MTTSSCLPDLANLARFPSTVTLSGVSIRSRLERGEALGRDGRDRRVPAQRAAAQPVGVVDVVVRDVVAAVAVLREVAGRRCRRSPRTAGASAGPGGRHGHQAGDQAGDEDGGQRRGGTTDDELHEKGSPENGCTDVESRRPGTPGRKTGCGTGLDPPPSSADGCGPRGRCQRGDVRCPSRSPARPVPARPLTSGAPTPMSSDTRPTRSTSPELDPRFVFDFRPADDPGDGQRFSTWLARRAVVPRPRATPRLGGDQPGRRGHRARRPEDRQGGRRLPRGARRPRRPRPAGRDGREALPRRGAPLLPPQHRLHRGPPHPEHPRRPRRWPRSPRTAGRSRPASGPGRSGRPSSGSGGPASRSPTRCRSTAPRSSWSSSPTTGRRPPGWRRPVRGATCWRRTSSSCARRWRRWPGTASRTATSRRTTSWPRANGW